MAQDIRELFEKEREKDPVKLPEGHEARFEDRLEKELSHNNGSNKFIFMKIAAVLVVLFGVGFLIFQIQETPINKEVVEISGNPSSDEDKSPTKQLTLADISPEFEKVENFYMASFNIGLSKLNITEENKALIDSFMDQFSELDKEYGRLNKELNEIGPNRETVAALIKNLQLRLELLFKLQNKLDLIKKENNEDFEYDRA